MGPRLTGETRWRPSTFSKQAVIVSEAFARLYSRFSISFLDQFQQAEAFGRMEAFAHGRLPGECVGIIRGTAAAEQIQAKHRSRSGRLRGDGGKRDPHGSVPDMFLLINFCEDFETGVPGPAVFVMGTVEIDIEVDPFALRRDFEFLVALDIGEVGADEGL